MNPRRPEFCNNAFRTRPTWDKVEEKAAAAGIDYKKRALQAQSKIKAAYDAKVQQIRDQKQERKAVPETGGPPDNTADIATVVSKLKARVEKLEAENLALEEHVQMMNANAIAAVVPLKELNRPLVPRPGN